MKFKLRTTSPPKNIYLSLLTFADSFPLKEKVKSFKEKLGKAA